MFIFNTVVNKATPCTGSGLQIEPKYFYLQTFLDEDNDSCSVEFKGSSCKPEPVAGKSASQPCRKQINLPTLLPESGEVKKTA